MTKRNRTGQGASDRLADRTVFPLDENKWDAFIEALDAPPRRHARLERLFREPSVFARPPGDSAQTDHDTIINASLHNGMQLLQDSQQSLVLNFRPLCANVTHMTNLSSTTVLSVRVNPDERAMLEAAADQAHTNLSDFVRRKALEAAENDVLNRSIVTIPAKDWEAFEAWAKRPPQANPGLRALLELTPTWER